jgi:autotransporter-associated beta strand protein
MTMSANLTIGVASGGTGIMNIFAGATANFAAGSNLIIGNFGTPNGTVNVYGGAVNIDPSSFLIITAGSGNTGTLNLSGGVVTTSAVVGQGGNSTVNLNGGTLAANANNNNLISGVTTINVLGGTSTIDNGGYGIGLNQTMLHGGTAAIDGGLIFQGSGTTTLTASNSYTGATTVKAGTVALNTPFAVPAFTQLNVGANALVVASQNFGTKNSLFLTGVSLAGSTNAWTGKIDLNNNDMVVRGGVIATLTNQVAMGYAGGTWQGTGGITSSMAANDNTHLTALGVIQNSADGSLSGAAIYTSFDGQTVANTDVLVKYTYYGDADLSGTVDGTDYSRIDNGFASRSTAHPLSGWFNGDFNYDGVIDGSDYTLIDNAFNTQGANISAQVAAQIGSGSVGAAVPEPATLSLLAIGAVGVLGRRRRSR